MNIKKLFDKPKVMGIIADVNQGKSMLIYHLLEELRKIGKFNLCTYGLRCKFAGAMEVNSLNEIEDVKNSLIIIDEFFTLFDLENRKIRRQIENSLRLIFHNNNILVLSGVGENFKKFISGKCNVLIYKKLGFDDLINGSKAKYVIMNYKGYERGTTLLNLEINEAIVWDGLHYELIKIPYLAQYDTKKDNKSILQKSSKKCAKKVEKR